MINKKLFCVVLCMCVGWVGTAIGRDYTTGRPNNPHGVMLGMAGKDFSDYASIHFRQAADLVGDWGYVRVGTDLDPHQIQNDLRTLAICRANKLIPVFSGLYIPSEYEGTGPDGTMIPIRDDGYPLAVQRYEAWARAMAAAGGEPPYLEFGNEINHVRPEAFGRFIIPVAEVLNKHLPGLNVTGPGLAGHGADWYDEMLERVPESKDAIDCWGLHPYGTNHPPSFEEDDYCLKGFNWTAEALAKHGIENPRFVMTESGYEIGDKKDGRFPRITDELRAQYLVEAYETIWVPEDERVVTLCVFMLQQTHWYGWDGWILINNDGTLTETYRALRDMPKPEGSDWQTVGSSTISGRVLDLDSGQGAERVFVYLIPGVYAAETDEDGYYTIEAIPEGEYTIHLLRDAFQPPAPETIVVGGADDLQYNAEIKRLGIIHPGYFDAAGPYPHGFAPTLAEADDFIEFSDEVSYAGRKSLRLSAMQDETIGVWHCTGYTTALPDRKVAAEVWVKGSGVQLDPGQAGALLRVSVTDSHAQSLTTHEVNLPRTGDFDWIPLAMTVPPVPLGRRLHVTLGLDAQAGDVWFADPYLHYAEYPVPSRNLLTADGTSTLAGFVTAPTEERMMGAIVCLTPGNYWAETRSDGKYEVTNIPAGTYDVWAFVSGYTRAVQRSVEIGEDTELRLDLQVTKPPAPRFVENGGFEDPASEAAILAHWKRYGEFDGIFEDGSWKNLPDHPNGLPAYSGNYMAGSLTGSNVKNGGIYQILETNEGDEYEAEAWIYTYQTSDGRPNDVTSRLGVDPTGGTDPDGPYVIWTPFRPSHMEWSSVTLRFTAVDDRATIFLGSRQVQGIMYSVNMFDEVKLKRLPRPAPGTSTTKPAGYQPEFLWDLNAPGADPDTPFDQADDIGPWYSVREEYRRNSGVTLSHVGFSWAAAEPEQLPEGPVHDLDWDWTTADRTLSDLPPRMAVKGHLHLDAPWAQGLMEEDEDEFWRLAERFMESVSRRAYFAGVRYWGVPGNEPSLTGRHDWGEMYMKPARHIGAAVHRGHPDNQVIAGALVVGARGHINVLYDHGFKEYCDVLDIHAYPSSPGERRYGVGLSQILESRQTLVEQGDKHKRIFLGEGWGIFPLPDHIDHLPSPPNYTKEDWAHYRKQVVYGYAALTRPRPGLYDPQWVKGASFFCMNDMWGSLGWAARAEIEYDEHGDPAFWLLDGYRFPYADGMMDPQFRTWGLIDINGDPKGDIINTFPPYIPKCDITTIFKNPETTTLVPGVATPVIITITNEEIYPFTNLRFSMDVFRGDYDGATFAPVSHSIVDFLDVGDSVSVEFLVTPRYDQGGKETMVQGNCEFDWLDEPYFVDGWLPYEVVSRGAFEVRDYQGLASAVDDSITISLHLNDETGTPLPFTLNIEASDELEVYQKPRGVNDPPVYEITFSKKDHSVGGAYRVVANAGPGFQPIVVWIAFPNPGHTPEQGPARGRLINPDLEEWGPQSSFEGWYSVEPPNWPHPSEHVQDLPSGGNRYFGQAYHHTRYPRSLEQTVLVPEDFEPGDKVYASVWTKGVDGEGAEVGPEAVQFRIVLSFMDANGSEITSQRSRWLRSTGEWEHLEFTSDPLPERTAMVNMEIILENTEFDGWHLGFFDKSDLQFLKQ